jgi:BirA family transcriptional regulator, biotin operon repressor / biotin---[acetyl-CoA-carboxylase] ligase
MVSAGAAIALGSLATAAGFRAVSFDTIGSTNQEALIRARAGDPGRLWLSAAVQTAGRGRRGRPWATPRGNLAATVLLIHRGSPALAATLGFVAGLALHDALAPAADAVAIALDGAQGLPQAPGRLVLKWPNDVLVERGGTRGKLAGILLEAEPLGPGLIAVAIGIGVNIAVAPTDLPYPAARLSDLGLDWTAEHVFMDLADRFAEGLALFDEGRGLPAVLARWRPRAAGLGGAVAVELGGRVIRGIFETVDDEGRLLIRDEGGARHVIAAGEVHFGVAATVAAGER